MDKSTKIKVFGIGGSGSNTITRMMSYKMEGVELVAINTDLQDLKKTRAHKKIRIGEETTKGLGTGMDPLIGKKAAEEDRELISKILEGSDLLFIACGLGGGTGTGAAPVIAEVSKSMNILTVAVVTTPFSFEGRDRLNIAKRGLSNLEDKVDTLISVSNDKLSSIIDPKTSVKSAFEICDEALNQAVRGISDLITLPGIINIDFADVRSILKSSGSAIFGIGRAQGEDRAKKAIAAALNSSLIETPCSKAKGVLFNVSGGEDINLVEINEMADEIRRRVAPDAKIIFGAVQGEDLKKGEIKVTVIATGF